MKLAPPAICTGCMACVDSCHHGALSITLDRDGFYQITTDKEKCVECGLCSKVCPILNPLLVDKVNIELSKPYAVWCTDESLRRISASGGAFSAIAKAFLKKGGVVYGAAIDGFEIRHQRIDKEEDLPHILGSKYQHSRMDGIYRLVARDLREGKTVLYSGLSCQVAGVLNSVPKKLHANLFNFDTICGGLSTMLPMRKLQELGEYTGIHSFRNKDTGWKSKGFKYALKMYKKDGSICDLGTDNMMIQCFCHKETKRLSCYDCRFNGLHRSSDATIGDFWGDHQFQEQHYNGLSVLVIHSDRLLEYLKEAPLHTEPVAWVDIVYSNSCIYWSHYPYMRKSYKRKRFFNLLRVGDDCGALAVLDKSYLMSRLEARLYQRSNDNEREAYLQQILNKSIDK